MEVKRSPTRTRYECRECGISVTPAAYRAACPECGGPLLCTTGRP